MPTKEELVAYKKNNKEMCNYIKAKSLKFLSIEGLYEALIGEKRNSNLKVLIHCFTGTKDFAKKLLDINCYISVSGIITFNNSNDLSDAISSIPIKNLLVETDSPYLAPVPYRGKSNEPSYIIHTVKKLAEAKNLTKDYVMKKTSQNFLDMFNIKI